MSAGHRARSSARSLSSNRRDQVADRLLADGRHAVHGGHWRARLRPQAGQEVGRLAQRSLRLNRPDVEHALVRKPSSGGRFRPMKTRDNESRGRGGNLRTSGPVDAGDAIAANAAATTGGTTEADGDAHRVLRPAGSLTALARAEVEERWRRTCDQAARRAGRGRRRARRRRTVHLGFVSGLNEDLPTYPDATPRYDSVTDRCSRRRLRRRPRRFHRELEWRHAPSSR